MHFFRKHTFLTAILITVIASLLIGGIINGNTLEKTTIKVHEGDTLWSLADQYRGELTHSEWINIVKKDNALFDDKIVWGHTLEVPVEGKIENKNELQVASDQK